MLHSGTNERGAGIPSMTKEIADFSWAGREAMLLAPYAMHGCESQGRRFPEADHPYRGPYQRDRDRVLHSSAFRRLSGKTQVFTGTMGDYHRTRMTHTMEVASIARTIGRALRLNEDLIETLALLHDIGHPPFGHAGEEALNDLLTDEGGFSHNQYALTLVEELERPYPQFPGLNLTREVLESQAYRIRKSHEERPPLLETQVVDLADSITYDAHDVDDAVKLNWLTLGDLGHLDLIRECGEAVQRQFGELEGRALRRSIVHELINRQVRDVLSTFQDQLATYAWPADETEIATVRLSYSPELAARKGELERFLYQRVYRHPRLIEARNEAQHRLRELVEHYAAHPELLPSGYRARGETFGCLRGAADYVAGMTDRFCLERHRRYVKPDDPA